MTTLGVQLRTFLAGKTGVGERIHQNKAPQATDKPFIWFSRATTGEEEELNPEVGQQPFSEMFDVECISTDIDEALAIADDVRAQRYYRGEFGTGRVQGVFITDHEDDYIPRGVDADSGLHVASVLLEIVGYTEG